MTTKIRKNCESYSDIYQTLRNFKSRTFKTLKKSLLKFTTNYVVQQKKTTIEQTSADNTTQMSDYSESVMQRLKKKKQENTEKKMCRCHVCGELKPAEDFNFLYKSKNKRMSVCKECEHETKRALRETKKMVLDSLKSVGCACCGEKDTVCLDFHHYDPTEKEFNMSSALTKPFEKMIEEASKCIVTCSNCHRKIHAGAINLEEFLPRHEYEYRKLLIGNLMNLFGNSATKRK